MGGVDSSSAAATRPEAGQAGVARRVQDEFRERIGCERYEVWFGEAVTIEFRPDRSGRKPASSGPRAGRRAAISRVSRSAGAGAGADADGSAREGGHDCVVVTAAGAFAADWLRKTFHAELEASVRRVCGPSVRVLWQAAEPSADRAAVGTSDTEREGSADGIEKRGQGDGSRIAESSGPREVTVPADPVAVATIAKRHSPGLAGFVVGPSNRMAYAAVELAAGRPGEMSPLVLHGPSGVGKTHLLEGICGLARERRPGLSTLMLSAEQFTTGFLQALHGSGLPGFRRACRSVDLLVIDDLQFFVGKRATLVELQHTVDALHRQGRQMVFACDREVESLVELGPELIARLRGGMNARILPPDYDVRRGIVAAIASRRGLVIPDDVVHYVATHMTRHARELAGAVNRLEATSHMLGLPITAEMAEESLADLVRSSGRSVRLADIERAVCSAFGIESGSLQSTRRAKTVNHPRMLAMFLARKHTASALAEIGSYFGRRSHSTVISAQKTVSGWVSSRSQIVLAESRWDVEEAIRRVEDVLRAG